MKYRVIWPTNPVSGWILAALLGVALGFSSQLASASDVKNGEQLARRWCATCHLVANDQLQASADVPSFLSIAQRQSFRSETTATFLLDPHPKMPSFTLSRQEASEIAEYIASLDGKQRK
ncbi:MAG: cytochrome c, partial [Chloroflexota bacterium]